MDPSVSAPRHPSIASVREIAVGRPLPFSVYDRNDNLLLRKGFVIHSEEQRDRLLEQGVFRHLGDEKTSSRHLPSEFESSGRYTVFETLEILIDRLERAYQSLESKRQRHRFAPGCLGLAVDLQRICADKPDAVLAAMQVSHQLPYGLIHPLHCGVVCELMGVRLQLPLMSRLSLVAAALSHDVGIARLQEVLHRQKAPLSETQWQSVQAHPQAGAQLLRQAGVDDPLWLDVVAQHHERLDGSGYPKGISGEKLRRETRILSIADIYTAMIRPRAYRDAFVAREVLRDLFQDRGATIDPELVRVFIGLVGIFPPGAFVRLANDDIAVVQARGNEPSRPECASLIDAEGKPMSQPLPRDNSDPRYQPVAMLPHHQHPALQGHLNRLWPPLEAIATL